MDPRFDFLSSILDEISLEGLDGITLETLWQRLGDRPEFPISIDEDSKDFIWRSIAKLKDIELYQLPKPRTFVPTFDRYRHVDPEHGFVCEPNVKHHDPHYPIAPIQYDDVRGSCAMYKTRRCVTHEVHHGNNVLLMSLEEAVEKWGGSLVLVASANCRLSALIGSETNPLVDMSRLEEYCLLERIGRSRYHGEVTQGESGLLSLKAAFCKHLHYYRKKLSTKGLITKQEFCMKSRSGVTVTGCLFHLKRFYVLRKTKTASLLKDVCDILKDKPQNRESCIALKAQLGSSRNAFKNLYSKSAQKWLKSSTIPCKELYPNGTEKQWVTSNGQDKMVKVLQLVKHCDEEDSEDDMDEGEKASVLNVHFDYSKVDFGVPLLYQVYSLVKRSGPEGVSLLDLVKEITLPKLEVRSFVRLLVRKGHIFSELHSRGKQVVHIYISNDYKNESEAYCNRKKQEKKLLGSEGEKKREEKLISEEEKSIQEKVINKQERQEKIKSYEVKEQEKATITGGVRNNISMKRKFDCSKDADNSKVKRILLDKNVKKDKTLEKKENICENLKSIKCEVNEIQNKSKLFGGSSTADLFSTKSSVPPIFSASKSFTYRRVKRCDILLDLLKREGFSTTVDLQRHIIEKEKEEGYNFTLDKKSIVRLIKSLLENNKIKKVVVELELENKKNEIEFICEKSLQISDQRFLLAVEQAKFRYFGVSKDSKLKSKLEEKNILLNKGKSTINKAITANEMEVQQETDQLNSLYKFHFMTPKFIRAKVLHRFLYYLVYQHKKGAVASKKQTVYHESMSWKRFVPPVSDYGHHGWCLIADVFSSLPLSLFVQLVNFRVEIPNLRSYLGHDEKTNYLIQFLPQSLRNVLLHKRKYLYCINGVIHLLCYMGLVSLGPQVGKHKDEALLYVHKKATLKDTTVSPPGYIHISSNVDYVTKSYTFENEDDVEKFWQELEVICFHTPLGVYSTAIGKTLVILNPSAKPELMKCTKNNDFNEVCDDGFVPGDTLGAGGFDSSLYLHTRKNWHLSTPGISKVFDSFQRLFKSNSAGSATQSRLPPSKTNYLIFPKERPLKMDTLIKNIGRENVTKIVSSTNKITENEKQKLKCNYPKGLRFKMEKVNDLNKVDTSIKTIGKKCITKIKTPTIKTTKNEQKRNAVKNLGFKTEKNDDCDKVKEGKLRNRNVHDSKNAVEQTKHFAPTEKQKNPLHKLRTIRKRASKRAPRHDNKDKFAISKLEKLRCHWTPQEDSFLLLCKVASCFLQPISQKPKMVVSYTVIRDLLHQRIPDVSADKTSCACERRMRYILKNPVTIGNVKVFLSEVSQDAQLVKEFDLHKPPRTKKNAWKCIFTRLINILLEKYTLSTTVGRDTNPYIPWTIQSFHEKFEIIKEKDYFQLNNVYQSPYSVDDVEKYTLLFIVLSAMAADEEKWTSKIHNIYQTYPEKLLQLAVAYLRKRQIISVKTKAHRSDIRHMRISTCPYKYSISYHNAKLPKFPIQTFKDAKILLDSLRSTSSVSNLELQGDIPVGFAVSVISLLALNELDIEIEVPDQVILFDSTLSKKAKDDIVKRMGQTLSEKDTNELTEYLSNCESFSVPSEIQFSMQDFSNYAGGCPSAKNVESYLIDAQKSSKASRFALYLLRHEMSQSALEKEQHSQDYIVLNACRILCHLKPATSFTLPVNPPNIIETTSHSMKTDDHTTKRLIKLNRAHIAEISSALKGYIPSEAFLTIFKYLDRIKVLYQQYLPQTVLDAQQIFNTLYEVGSTGMFEIELWRKFRNLSGELNFVDHLKIFRKEFLVVRVGVVAFVYVSSCFAKKWLLLSSQALDTCKTKEHTECKSVTENTSACFLKDEACSSVHYPSHNSKGNLRNIPEKYVQDLKTTTNSKMSTKEIYFIPRTWRNPDGSLNKPVLSDLLFTLLTHLLSSPGASTEQLCDKFSLVLPPVQVLELLEVLEKSFCIHKYYCRPVQKVTLFSDTPKTCIVVNPEPGDLDHFETYPDAVCKITELMEAIV